MTEIAGSLGGTPEEFVQAHLPEGTIIAPDAIKRSIRAVPLKYNGHVIGEIDIDADGKFKGVVTDNMIAAFLHSAVDSGMASSYSIGPNIHGANPRARDK